MHRNIYKKIIHVIYVVTTTVSLLLIFNTDVLAAAFVKPNANYSYYINELSVDFSDKSTDPDNKITEWYWNLGDGNYRSMTQSFTYTYKRSGIYKVTLEVVDETGLRDTETKEIVIDGPELLPPTPYFYFTVTDKEVTFIDSSSDVDSEITEWYWNLGDGTYALMEQSVTHTYAEGGVYNVVLEVVDETGLRASITREVVVISSVPLPPVADFDYSADYNQVSFKDISYDPDRIITEWYWDLGDGSHVSMEKIFSHTYEFGGDYTVKLEVVDSTGLRDIKQKEIHIDGPQIEPPVADFYYSSGDLVTFGFVDISTTQFGNITEWYWNLGDGTHISMEKEVVHSYARAGTYTVKLEVVNDYGARSIVEKTIEAVGLPVYDPYVTFYKDITPESLTVGFHDDSLSFNGEVTEWYWNFGDGEFAEMQKDVVHTYANSGIYIVILEVVDNFGARGTYQEEITVTGPSQGVPEAYFTFYNDQETPSFTFYDMSTSPNGLIVERYWDFGDGSYSSNEQIVEHTYEVAGMYTVTLEVVDINGERDTYSVTFSAMPYLFD